MLLLLLGTIIVAISVEKVTCVAGSSFMTGGMPSMKKVCVIGVLGTAHSLEQIKTDTANLLISQ